MCRGASDAPGARQNAGAFAQEPAADRRARQLRRQSASQQPGNGASEMHVDDIIQDEVDGEVDGLHCVADRRDQVVPIVGLIRVAILQHTHTAQSTVIASNSLSREKPASQPRMRRTDHA